jgi:tetratricopeptide (TPR) repeat protein
VPPDTVYDKAIAQMRERNFQGALQTLAIPAHKASHYFLRTHCFWALGQRSDALAAAAQAQRLAPADAAMQDAIGALLSMMNDQSNALAAAEKAVALQPANPSYRYNRATIRRFLGDTAGAEADYDVVIAARPADSEAYLNRSELRTQTAQSNHVPEIQAALAKLVNNPQGAVQLHYALAKEYEDLGQYDLSFQHLRKGADLRRSTMRYDVAVDVATVDWIIKAFPAAISPPADASGNNPIFIVGLPRTGSTLVERIISSHSDISGAEELDCFALALVSAASRGNSKMAREELVRASASVNFAALGEDYLRRASAKHGLEGRFIDKMPLNYLYCGLIQRALPNAKIIHVTRHPMAACYAMYKTLFKAAYPFSYNLDDLAKYYVGYRRLMDHWRNLLGEALLEVRYEDVVNDQLGQTQRLLRYCELPWQDQCLEFHRNPAATTTASAAQVRRPIYNTSLDKWRHLEQQLAPLKQALIAAGIQV